MRIWLYCICRNEELILPYFLRHYTPWVERLTFFDDQSTDKTRELIQACPQAILRDWPGTHGIVDDEFLDFAHTQWKEAIGHADWVIWVDTDEFLYNPWMNELLEHYLKVGVTIPRVQGFTMIADHFPTTQGQIYDEIRTGVRDDCWDKHSIFRGDIRWNVGRHSINLNECQPVFSEEASIGLLHYRCLGLDYLQKRHQRNWDRVPQHCRARNYGNNCQPGWEDHHGVAWFARQLAGPLKDVLST